ncbi:MAG TPA: UTP--glucose-1-phosphate uridylyltransferase, partial [Actinomycetota bacterium]|nr:UTP--glucose-1-phosphate uridylyltransferase [Actinomycetota bacterium]
VTLEDHFDRSLELEHHLEAVGKLDLLEEVRAIADLADFHYVRQKEPLGFGHAVLIAKDHIGDDAFFVMVGDEIVPEPQGAEPELLLELAAVHDRTGGSVIVVKEVADEDVSSYGIVAVEDMAEGVGRLTDMVEKPAVGDAPSRLGSRGRYLFTPGIFDAIERTPRGVGGEIQLTDAIKLLAAEEPVHVYVHDGPIYDVGKKLDYLRTTIELALRRDDLGAQLMEFLREVVARGS